MRLAAESMTEQSSTSPGGEENTTSATPIPPGF